MADVVVKVVVALLCLFKGHFNTCEAKNCYQALAECNSDARCSVKLSEYAKECDSIVDDTYNTIQNTSKYPCSSACVKAIKSLKKTAKGNVLWKCDCYLDAHCISLKTRTEKCLAIENGTYKKRVGCSFAHYKCRRDSRCKVAQIDFLNKCLKVFALTACTNQCLCSQKRLFNLPVGRPLLDCECDGSDELYCLGLRAHVDSMKCSWKKRRSRKRLKKRCKRCRQRKGDKCGRRSSKKKD